jgi:hypothetical protein
VHRTLILLIVMFSTAQISAAAHEWTPTYPDLSPSHVRGISQVDMKLFNAREDVQYYEFEVFDKDFKSVPYASKYRVMPLEYLGRSDIRIYIKNKDRDRVVYICSRSKITAEGSATSSISSRICSKIKR